MLTKEAKQYTYSSYGKIPIKQIAEKLQVSQRTVASFAQKLGVTKRNTWTTEELELLHELAETMPFKFLIRAYRMRAAKRNLKPCRSHAAIRVQLQRLGYSINPQINYFSCSQVAGALGINRNTVGNWIRTGKLKATRRDDEGGWYDIKKEDLCKFVVRCRDDIISLNLDSEAWRWLLVQFEPD